MVGELHLKVVGPAAQPRESWDSSRSLHSHLEAMTGMGTALLHVSSVPHPEEEKQEDSPELGQEMSGDPAVQVVPCHQEGCGTRRTVVSLLPNLGVLRASSI